ncbi:MAG: sulfurtransferase, partial [Hyphomicrobiales bacterium]|nr:sulfurtransferase [Hyphomicrobiales bacterium]
AVYFDIDDIADTKSPLPHMLPDPIVFSSRVRKLGIGDGQRIVVYDGTGLISAPRVWMMFRVMGVSDVAILDGGLPKWDDEQRPLESGLPLRVERHFTARFDHGAVADLAETVKALETGSAQVVDTRPARRFLGEGPEPRPNVPSGHMPGAINLPFSDILTNDFRLKPEAELRAAIDAAGVDLAKPIITSCGSGVTAAILNFALETLGVRGHRLFDGSWTEWVSAGDLPIVTGEE